MELLIAVRERAPQSPLAAPSHVVAAEVSGRKEECSKRSMDRTLHPPPPLPPRPPARPPTRSRNQEDHQTLVNPGPRANLEDWRNVLHETLQSTVLGQG